MNKQQSGAPSPTLKPAEVISQVKIHNDKHSFAHLLGVSYGKHLVYYLHRMPVLARYRSFSIPKRGGGQRLIEAPNSGLVRVQRRLATLLTAMYSPRQGVHGYVLDQGIYSNAEPHVRARFVLNVDLEGFFYAINFGRVRGALRAQPYNLSDEVATLIAQICCHNGRLPQGAPTSPIVSNIVAATLDAKLKAIAKAHDCFYTRYADDITLSRTRSPFPSELAKWEVVDGRRTTVVGGVLSDAIAESSFQIDSAKVRLLSKSDRQTITGLVVNRKINVRRTYIRNLRAALHAWRKHGLNAAQTMFDFAYGGNGQKKLERVLRGRIQYVGFIRGYKDQIYCGLRDQYNEICIDKIPVSVDPKLQKLKKAVWVIESEDGLEQGTAFFLEGYGLVTCAHCVGSKPFIYHPSEPAKKYSVVLKKSDSDIDVATLEIVGLEQEKFDEIRPQAFQTTLEVRADITPVGYPQHAPGKDLSIKDGRVQSFSMRSGIRRVNVTTPIIAGNSGGPLLSRHGRVLGIAVTGADDETEGAKTEEHGVIPISVLAKLA